MTSDFRLNSADDLSAWVIVSNGTAEYLVQCWLRVLESTNPGSPVVSFLRHRVEVGCPGMYGFDLDQGALTDADARRLLAVAVERVADECLAAIQGSPADESLRFLTTHQPFYQARWLSLQERIHHALRRSRIGLPRQLVLRREQCELQNRASKFFDASARKQALYELADVEEALEFREAAGATTRKAAELEASAEIADLAREIAASRSNCTS